MFLVKNTANRFVVKNFTVPIRRSGLCHWLLRGNLQALGTSCLIQVSLSRALNHTE